MYQPPRSGHRRALKLTALVGLCFLLVVVAVLNIVPPATGYEISLYGAYPRYFWIALIGAIFSGQLVILGSAIYGEQRDRSWVFGVALILVSDAILLLMPYIRGYPIYGRGDVLTHLGYVKDLSEVGIDGNIYPLMHLHVQALSHASGLPPSTVINLLPVVVSFVCFGGMFYLVVGLFDRTQALFCLPFVTVPFVGGSHSLVVPFTLSVLFVPFVLYVLFKEQQTTAISIRVALVVTIAAAALYHPLTAFMMLPVYGMYVGLKRAEPFRSRWQGPTKVASLATVIFAAWYLRLYGIINRFETVYERVLGRAESASELDTYVGTVNTYSPRLVDLVEFILLRYGVGMLLFGLATVFIAFALYRWLSSREGQNLFPLFFSCAFLLFAGLSVAFLLNNFIAGWGRPLAIGKIFAAVLSASFFYYLWSDDVPPGRSIITLSLAVCLLSLAVLSLLSVYPTLEATQNNHQVTEMEIDGTEWMLENRNSEIPLDGHRLAQYRFEHLHNGTLNETIRRYETRRPPDHFGYDRSEVLGAFYEQDRYLMVNRLGEETYPKQFPGYEEHWRFTPDDFAQLDDDRSVSLIYDNGEVKTYYVRTTSDQDPGGG